MSRFRNVIFDFDGTISNSREDIASAQLWVLHQLGVNGVRKEDLFPHIGKSLQETFRILLPAERHGDIPDAVRMYSEYYPSRALLTTRPFPGVPETLEALAGAGVRLAVASTKRSSGIHRAAEHFGITRHFVQLQGSDDIPFKPDPAIIHRILRDQGWGPAETLMVGDTAHDIEAGRRAGVATCGVTYGALSEAAIRACTPDFVVRRFTELLPLLLNGSGVTSEDQSSHRK
jgi:phosphoglycolate phosphatase